MSRPFPVGSSNPLLPRNNICHFFLFKYFPNGGPPLDKGVGRIPEGGGVMSWHMVLYERVCSTEIAEESGISEKGGTLSTWEHHERRRIWDSTGFSDSGGRYGSGVTWNNRRDWGGGDGRSGKDSRRRREAWGSERRTQSGGNFESLGSSCGLSSRRDGELSRGCFWRRGRRRRIWWSNKEFLSFKLQTIDMTCPKKLPETAWVVRNTFKTFLVCDITKIMWSLHETPPPPMEKSVFMQLQSLIENFWVTVSTATKTKKCPSGLQNCKNFYKKIGPHTAFDSKWAVRWVMGLIRSVKRVNNASGFVWKQNLVILDRLESKKFGWKIIFFCWFCPMFFRLEGDFRNFYCIGEDKFVGFQLIQIEKLNESHKSNSKVSRRVFTTVMTSLPNLNTVGLQGLLYNLKSLWYIILSPDKSFNDNFLSWKVFGWWFPSGQIL